MHFKFSKKIKQGFTLLEILLVVGIISLLAGIVIIAINPSKQLATVRNTQRQSDIKQLNSAITQYYIKEGRYPSTVLGTLTEICDTGTATTSSTCGSLVDLSMLVPTYITAIPVDPQASTTNGAGYQIVQDSTTRRIGLSAPAELGQTIIIGTVPTVVVDYSCGDPTDASCWSTTEVIRAWSTEYVNTNTSESETLHNGKENTAALYALGPTYAAAYHCYTLTETINGVVPPSGTWYLPSYAELWAGWDTAWGLSGGFPSPIYWSSTEEFSYPDIGVWYLSTGYGGMNWNFKDPQNSVRCLR